MSEEQVKFIVVLLSYLPTVFLFVLVAASIARSIAFIRVDEVAIVHRLGRFLCVLKGGWRFVIPMIDQINDRQKIRQTLAIPSEGYVSNDGVAFEVVGVISIEIVDLREAVYQVADFRESLRELAHQALKKEIVEMSRLSVSSAKVQLKTVVTTALNAVARKWGIAIADVTIEDVRQVDGR